MLTFDVFEWRENITRRRGNIHGWPEIVRTTGKWTCEKMTAREMNINQNTKRMNIYFLTTIAPTKTVIYKEKQL